MDTTHGTKAPAGPASPNAGRLTLSLLRTLGPTATGRIAAAVGLDRDQSSTLLRTLALARMIRVDQDPVVPGRRRVRLTSAGRVVADEIATREGAADADVAPTWDLPAEARDRAA